MAYKAPIWEDGKSPAISADNLNNLSQAAEGAQVLFGNSAPTSSTEGAVGQFYLVVVPDSDGNYPLYQCVAIANGSYTWRDTRRIPDSITSMLGISAPGTINRALNVLANVGNLHVWERVLTTIDASYVERRVNISDANIFSSDYQSSKYYARFNVSDSINITSSGHISLVSPTQVEIYFQSGALYNFDSLKGKYIFYVSTASNSSSSFPGSGEIGYISSDAEVSVTHSNYYQANITSGAYKVDSVFVPAGTTTDYLTSTDPNAYPKQSAAGGQDAYYTLGDVVTGKFGMGMRYASSDYIYSVASEISVADDGTISLKNPSEFRIGGSDGTPGVAGNVTTSIAGKYIQMTQQGPRQDQMAGPFSTAPSAVLYIPSEVVTTREDIGSGNTYTWYFIDRYQPVTGHAAIPANTTITYLGQLGEGARIEVGSYVGTGTYGSSNPNSLTFGFEPKMVLIFTGNTYSFSPYGFLRDDEYFNVVIASRSTDSGVSNKISWNSKTVSWYASSYYGGGSGDLSHYGVDGQLNASEKTYHYIAIG